MTRGFDRAAGTVERAGDHPAAHAQKKRERGRTPPRHAAAPATRNPIHPRVQHLVVAAVHRCQQLRCLPSLRTPPRRILKRSTFGGAGRIDCSPSAMARVTRLSARSKAPRACSSCASWERTIAWFGNFGPRGRTGGAGAWSGGSGYRVLDSFRQLPDADRSSFGSRAAARVDRAGGTQGVSRRQRRAAFVSGTGRLARWLGCVMRRADRRAARRTTAPRRCPPRPCRCRCTS